MAAAAATGALGALLRLTLALDPSIPAKLAQRSEVATPLSSWTRLREGHFLLTRGANPYAAGSFHGPPLLLALAGPLTGETSAARWASLAAWIAADLGTAWALARVAERRQRGALSAVEGETRWSGTRVAAIYLFHPFSIATTLARCSTTFANLFLALAIEAAVSGSAIQTAFFLSLATHLSLYPVLLLPPLLLLVARHSVDSSAKTDRRVLARTALTGVAAFLLHQAVLISASRWWTGGWEFLSSAYGVILTIPGLTPNIGLAWYFFIEMFDHFRSFFLVIFALHPLVYVAPLSIAYRRDPLFAVVVLIGTIALLKSYPSFGDWGFWHALLGCYSELLPCGSLYLSPSGLD
ncbi:putative GPI transamidase component PIG-U [Rhodotorula toruloides ATCC 204091]|uniref:Putative GPI transamidase component PIG-U n=1 Tax=Rhodotorula toruloides TaxID=5286 RepID=A0A0K3CFD1_RHOTO|nr:putative GPI transamidase component PIG-U [Rhodotorula toruloides ATCC 204091]PRQ75966.1 putative GPI transamidase component PIG-U [Rhodotorula toruloides]